VSAANELARFKRWTALIALVAMTGTVSAVSVVASSTPVSAIPVAITPVDLGLASTFSVLTIAAVGNTATLPATILRGDLGAGGAVTGFPPGVYTGGLYPGTAANPALADLAHAYSDAQARPGGAVLSATLIGTTATPGIYKSTGAVANTGTFTIDGQNVADAVFIFQVGGALSAAASSHMVLVNGAKASNVFWQVNGAATVGASASFVGTIMAMDAIDIGAGSIVNGRALARTGAIALDGNQFYSTPPAVTITGGANAFTTDTSPAITGTTDVRSPSTVSVSIHGESLTATPLSDGTWSATPVGLLANGPYTVTASVVDGAGNIGSASQNLTVDTELPIVTIDGGTSVLTNDTTPTLSGTTDVDPGQIVHLTISRTSPATTITATALVQPDWSWNSTPSGFSSGTWTATAMVTDPAGNTNTDTQTLVIDTVGPTAEIDGGATALTRDARPSIEGTATGSTLVVVAIDGQNLAGLVQTGTSWSVPYPVALPSLSNGPHNISMTATDAASNVATDSQVLTVDTIFPVIGIDPGPTDATNDVTPTISGTTDVAGGAVSVTIGSQIPRTALVQGDGSWNTTSTIVLPPGAVTVSATVTDRAGNVGTAVQTLTIDLSAPVITITGGPSKSSADATPVIAGNALGVSAGSSVTVTFAGRTLTSTIAGNGAWSVTAATVANGNYVVIAQVVDAAGNLGSASQSLTINAAVPVVTISGGLTMTTSDATPMVAGTTNAVAGSLATVTIAGQTLLAIVQPGGSWNVTSANLGNGMVAVSASVTDLDGNMGLATQSLTIEASAPTNIAINGGASRSTNDATPMISGTTDANDGRQITVTVGTQTMTATVSAGTWSVVAAHLADGTYVVNATASAVGGTPGAASQSMTIDTVAPVVLPGGGLVVVTGDSTPPITGTGATPGSTVTVTVAGQTLTTTAGADGSWSVTPTALPPGTYTVVITITDPAGNLGIGTQALTVTVTGTVTPPPAAVGAEYISVGPKRVFDTRPGQSPNAIRAVVKQQVGGAYELHVQMTDIAGFVPADGVGAVSLNVTSTGSAAAGFITVYACGTRELVSSVNFPAQRTVANAVVAPVSANGEVCFYANTPTDIVVDVNGWFATGKVFTAVGPKRVFDTRSGQSPDALRSIVKIQIPAGGTIEVRLTDLPGFVPADGVGSVSLNVVVANPEAEGFITVNACGGRSLVSSVNFVARQTVANAVFAPVSAAGTVCFFSSAATDLVVDINGWLKSGSGFNAVGPARVLDTRAGNSPDALRDVPKAKIGGGNVLEVKVTGLVGFVPAGGVGAVSLNVTATNPDADGFITVFSCGTMEEVSSLNYAAGSTVANAVLARVSPTGTICLYSNAPTDVVVDINGWISNAV
jgi:hypothetical protein